MRVNLETTKVEKVNETTFELIFDLPKLYFNSTQTVYANEIVIYWGSRSSSNALLQSTLIDKSPLNMKQQLLFINKGNLNTTTYYSPTRIQEYKIQRAELQSSQFYIVTSEKVNIQKVYLQLFFTDARVQQINKK